MANEIQAKNGVLLCQNGNLHKEIGAYRRKIEDTKYMIYSIENSLKLLQSERSSSDKHHDEASKLFHMDRHVTLSDIERRYVKKTKELIDLDKDISNKIVMYEKEKGILVYLEKTAEKLEEEI